MAHYLTLVLTLLLTAPALAAPPPAPPEYIYKAGQVLIAAGEPDIAAITRLLADDVVILENGKRTATGREAGTALLIAGMKVTARRVITYSVGQDELLVVDRFDSVDRSRLLPTIIMDPSFIARSIFYQFGTDRLIHAVHVSAARGLWSVPKD